MRHILLNTYLVIFLVTSVVSVSFWYSLQSDDFLWLSRAGSVVTVLGLLLTIKNSIFSASRDIRSVVFEKNHYARYAPREDSETYRSHIKHAQGVIRDEYIGFFLSIVGTILWGYGDLVGQLFT